MSCSIKPHPKDRLWLQLWLDQSAYASMLACVALPTAIAAAIAAAKVDHSDKVLMHDIRYQDFSLFFSKYM